MGTKNNCFMQYGKSPEGVTITHNIVGGARTVVMYSKLQPKPLNGYRQLLVKDI